MIPGRPRCGPLPLPAALVVAGASGVALFLAFPSIGWWPLAAVGVAGLVVALAGRRPLAAAGIGLVSGLAFFGPLLHWAGIYVGPIAWIPLVVLQALYVAAFALTVPWALRCPGGPAVRAVALAGLWVAVEALRARTPFGGFGWGRLGFSQAESPLLPLAAIGGVPLVSFAIALAGALLGLAVLALSARRRLTPALLALAALTCLLPGLAVPLPTAAEEGELQVAAVQGNVPRPGLEFNAERRAVLDNHVAETRRLAEAVASGEAPAPDLVVWPENASDIDPLRNADAARVIDAAAAAIDAPLLVGAVLVRDEDTLSNTTLVWQSGEGPVQRYDKRHPVPFAEYVPYRSFFRRITSAVDMVPRDFVAGDRVGVLDVAGTRVGDLICFEVVDDGLVRDTVTGGARLVVVQTNNATFGYTDESVQQLAMSRLRAVEHGRAVVHVSTVGVSAMIAPDGRLLESSGLFTADVLQAALPLRSSITLATRLGAAPELGLAALGLLGAAAGLVAARGGPPGSTRRRPRVGKREGAAPRGAAGQEVVTR